MGKNRFGSIKITKEMIIEDSKNLSIAFSKIGFVPVWIENNYLNVVKYIGFSEMFREVEEGCRAPGYKISITTDKDMILTDVTVEEVEL